MIKILFVSTTLGNGGAERVMTYLLNYLSMQDEFQIALLLLKDEHNDYLKNLVSDVSVYRLHLRKKRIKYQCLRIIKEIARLNPDICFTGLSGLNILLAPFIKWFTPNIKFIVRETLVLSARYKNNKIMPIIYKLFYNNYNLIIAQSDDMYDDLIQKWGISPKKCIKINNPINPVYIEQEYDSTMEQISFHSNAQNKFVSIGRLTYQKGYDLLLERLSENRDIDFCLLIFGEGDLKSYLQKMIERLHLSNKVKLMGFSSHISTYIQLSDGVIMSSRFEGFPNTLLEANILGKPVLANNCPGGINEIVIPGQNGYITQISNASIFRKDFIKFINTKFNSLTIKELTTKRYASEVILKKYKQAFIDLWTEK